MALAPRVPESRRRQRRLVKLRTAAPHPLCLGQVGASCSLRTTAVVAGAPAFCSGGRAAPPILWARRLTGMGTAPPLCSAPLSWWLHAPPFRSCGRAAPAAVWACRLAGVETAPPLCPDDLTAAPPCWTPSTPRFVVPVPELLAALVPSWPCSTNCAFGDESVKFVKCIVHQEVVMYSAACNFVHGCTHLKMHSYVGS